MARLNRGRARRERQRQTAGRSLMFWLRLVVVFVLVALFMVQVMRILDQSYWRQTEIDTAVSRFGQTAMLVNSEWLRKGRHGPVELQLGGLAGAQRSIMVDVNENGWPLPQFYENGADMKDGRAVALPPEMTDAGCAALWRTLSQAPDLLQLGLTAEWRIDDGLCMYRYQRKKLFTYRLHNGHLMML